MTGSGDNDKDKTVIGGSFDDVFKAMGIARPPTAGAPPPQANPFGAAPPAAPFAPPPAAANPFAPPQPGPPGFPPQAGGPVDWGLPGSAPQSMPQAAPASSPFPAPSPFPFPAPASAPFPPASAGFAPMPQAQPSPFGQPAQPFGGAPSPFGAPPAAGGFGAIGQPGGMGANPAQGLFPVSPVQPTAAPQPPAIRIDLQTALAAKGFPPGALKNPLVAQAANLLVLFGRLRMQVVAMEAIPLVTHVAQEIETYEANLTRAGNDQREVMVGKYFLCATADDIVQNLPGTDRHVWLQYSMTARFFGDRTSGSGFFHEVDKLLAVPAQSYRLLELALLCLSLGLEGRFRTEPQGDIALQRYRAAVYESLRRVEPRPDEDISVHWQPVVKTGRQKLGGASLLALAGALAAGLVGGFLTLRTLLGADTETAAAALRALVPSAPAIQLGRAEATELALPTPTAELPATGQMERIQTALAAEIGEGKLEVGRKGDFIYLRLVSDTLFASGKADASADFAALASSIGTVVDAEPGQVKVVGYTDNRGLRATNKFKNNVGLSLARAKSVVAILAEHVADPARLESEGRGEEEPIADNATDEGRAKNRRVEIWLPREETL